MVLHYFKHHKLLTISCLVTKNEYKPFLFNNRTQVSKGFGLFSIDCKCPLSEGIILNMEAVMMVVKPARNKKGAFQVNLLASHRPSGTPKTEAAEKAVITMPMAEALLSKGIRSLIMANTRAPKMPPNAPARIRAANKK